MNRQLSIHHYCDLLIRPNKIGYEKLLHTLYEYDYKYIGILYNELPRAIIKAIEEFAEDRGLIIIRRIHINKSNVNDFQRYLSKYKKKRHIFSIDMDIAETAKKYLKHISIITFQTTASFKTLKLLGKNGVSLEVQYNLLKKYLHKSGDEFARIIRALKIADSHKSLVISSGAESDKDIFPPKQLAYTILGLIDASSYYDYYIKFRWEK